jgi:hypothetical protein
VTQDTSPPTLLFIVGPPAVGKMAVGDEIARRTGLRLFHNHLSIEPVLRFFEFGTPPFWRLVEQFRNAILSEVANSELPGLIFTFVWAFNLGASEEAAVERYAAPFRARGGRVLFLELEASLEERLRRNKTESRLTQKPSMRDTVKSERRLLELEGQYTFNTTGERDGPDWLRIDNTRRSAENVAELAIEHFGLRALDQNHG